MRKMWMQRRLILFLLLFVALVQLPFAETSAQDPLPRLNQPSINGRTVSWNAIEHAHLKNYRLRWRRPEHGVASGATSECRHGDELHLLG